MAMHKCKTTGHHCEKCEVHVEMCDRSFQADLDKDAKITEWPEQGAPDWSDELKLSSAFIYNEMSPDEQRRSIHLSVRYWHASICAKRDDPTTSMP